MSPRQVLLVFVKAIGGFAVSRILTAHGLRIVCYHGISLADEHLFQPKAFMREETLRQRFAHLKRRRYPVLALDDALELLQQSRLPPRALVITFDDGWGSTGTNAVPVLRAYRFPSTVYVTTRDVVDEVPVFNVALRYLLYKLRGKTLDLGILGLDAETVALDSPTNREHAACRIAQVAASMDSGGKQSLLLKLAEALRVYGKPLGQLPDFRLMSWEQLAQLPERGMDLQLHTHDHELPWGDPEGIGAEIQKNRVALERVTSRPLVHLSYPDGKFSPDQFPALRALGIESATTCLSGFNYLDTEPLELRRFLDSEIISQVEFEAEVSGFLELMRKLKRVCSARTKI